MNGQTRITSLLGCLLVVVFSVALSAAPPSFQPVPPPPGSPPNGLTRANGISGDGTAFAGQGIINFLDVFSAYRWKDGTGFTHLPNPFGGGTNTALATSMDGTFVVGQVDGGTNPAFRWSQGTGVQILGTLPGGGGGNSIATGVSGDGSIVVGQSASATTDTAFRWTQVGGMVSLGNLGGGIGISRANAVTPDGLTIVGFGTSASGKEAMFHFGGVMTGIGDLPGGAFSSEAKAVSASGGIIVGNGTSANGTEAFLWNGGMIGLGDLPGGTFSSDALAVSADGSLVVGRARNAGGNAAFIWDAVNGMRDLQTFLSVDLGLNLQGMTLRNASGISADGTVIVGNGVNAAGVETAWRAVIPEPSSLALLALGLGMVVRRTNSRRM